MRQGARIGVLLVAMAACGGDGDDAESTAGAGGSTPGAGGVGGATSGGGGVGGATSGGGGVGGSTPGVPAYGRFGQATTTFTLPEPAPREGELPEIAYPDLAGSFPEVDWSALDRLYIPAGRYRSILLG